MPNLSRLRRVAAPLLLVLALSACSTEEMIFTAFAERGANPQQIDEAIRIAHCESNHNWEAISPGGGNWGLFQINTVHRGRVAAMGIPWEHMLSPYQNAQVAADIWAEQGWSPWTCARILGIR